MDISNLANLNTAIPLAKAGKVSGDESTTRGKFLPADGQPLMRLVSQDDRTSNPTQDAETLQGLVDKANETLSVGLSNLKFTVAEGTDIPVVRVEDAETGELIRQIPSEQMVALAKALEEIKQGMLVKEKV